MNSAERYIELCKNDIRFCFKNEFKIRTYDPVSMRWNLCPLKLNPEQEHLLTVIDRQLKERGFVRIIIDKARKLGMSTFIQALKMHTCIFNPESHALTVAHEESATRELFRIGKRIAENIDPRVATALKSKAKGNSLEWQNGSRAECQTQGGSPDSERGSTPNFLHISELPSWESSRRTTSAADVAQALLNAVPNQGKTIVIIESTAKGMGNLFYEIWNRAVKGEPGNLFEPVFYSWTGRDSCIVAPPDADTGKREEWLDEQMRLAHAADDIAGFHAAANELGYTQLQRERAIEYNLNPSQVRFWRQTLVNQCANDQDRFDQEWPVSWEVSFVSSGRGVFPSSLVQSRLDELKDYTPLAKGTMLRNQGSIKVQQDGGSWEIYKWAEPGHTYIVSGDAAGGGRSKDDDYSCVQVFDRVTEEQVAEFYAKVPPDRLADEMAMASKLYNNAMVAPECNGPGLVTIHELMTKHPECTIYRRFSQPGQIAGSETKLLGYSTNVKTRHFLFGQFESAIRRNEVTIYSKRLLGEMLTLIRSKGTGRPEASPGYHDDACVSFAIALDVSRMQADMGVPSVKDEKKINRKDYESLVMPYSNIAATPTDDFPEGESSWF